MRGYGIFNETPTIDFTISRSQKEQTTDSYRSKVRIRLLWIQPIVVLNILERLIRYASITAVIALWSRTIHQVLLTQRNQLSSFAEQLTLQGTCRAESPARSTTFLEPQNRTLLPNIHATHVDFKTLRDTQTYAPGTSLINCLLGLW